MHRTRNQRWDNDSIGGYKLGLGSSGEVSKENLTVHPYPAREDPSSLIYPRDLDPPWDPCPSFVKQPYTVFARVCPHVRFTRFCPALRFLAKITCAYHVFAQFSCTRATSGVHGQPRVTDTRFCPKVRFTRFCPALRFLTKITCGYHVFAQFSCTRPTSGYRWMYLGISLFHDLVHMVE